jgi:hypothetical protein
MVDRVNRRLSSKPVEKDYLVEFVNRELNPLVERLRLTLDAIQLFFLQGEGSPEGVVEAVPSSLYQRSDGTPGTLLYLKQTGTDASGWVAIA